MMRIGAVDSAMDATVDSRGRAGYVPALLKQEIRYESS